MATNTSVSLVTNISIWDLGMSGWSLNLSGWSVSKDGSEIILIGKATPFAMIVSEPIATDIFSQGVTSGQSLHRRRRGKTNFDWRFHTSCDHFKIVTPRGLALPVCRYLSLVNQHHIILMPDTQWGVHPIDGVREIQLTSPVMNIMIEDAETLKYLGSDGLWTKNAVEGKDFMGVSSAFTVAKNEPIHKFNIVGYISKTKQFINMNHGNGKGPVKGHTNSATA
jgi:hypothetical protein